MKKSSRYIEVLVLFVMAAVLIVCLHQAGAKRAHSVDTSDGLSYILGMETQDVQYVEHNLTNGKTESGGTKDSSESTEMGAMESMTAETTEPTAGAPEPPPTEPTAGAPEPPPTEPTAGTPEPETKEPVENPEPSTKVPVAETTEAPTKAPVIEPVGPTVTEPATEPSEPETKEPVTTGAPESDEQNPTEPNTEQESSAESTESGAQEPTGSIAGTEAETTRGQEDATNQCYLPYTVDQAKVAAALAQLDAGTLLPKALYSEALFVGDSIVEDFICYDVLSKNNVYAKLGANIYTHLSVQETQDFVVQYSPKYLFLHYGLNEMQASAEKRDMIIAAYKRNIQALQARLPYTKIYVLGLHPVTDAAIAKQSRFTWIGSYNEQMREMCQELGIAFYQNDEFFYERMHLFGSDGIHFGIEIYTQWIRDITEKMGID